MSGFLSSKDGFLVKNSGFVSTSDPNNCHCCNNCGPTTCVRSEGNTQASGDYNNVMLATGTEGAILRWPNNLMEIVFGENAVIRFDDTGILDQNNLSRSITLPANQEVTITWLAETVVSNGGWVNGSHWRSFYVNGIKVATIPREPGELDPTVVAGFVTLRCLRELEVSPVCYTPDANVGPLPAFAASTAARIVITNAKLVGTHGYFTNIFTPQTPTDEPIFNDIIQLPIVNETFCSSGPRRDTFYLGAAVFWARSDSNSWVAAYRLIFREPPGTTNAYGATVNSFAPDNWYSGIKKIDHIYPDNETSILNFQTVEFSADTLNDLTDVSTRVIRANITIFA